MVPVTKGHSMVSVIACIMILISLVASRYCNDKGEWNKTHCYSSKAFDLILSLV